MSRFNAAISAAMATVRRVAGVRATYARGPQSVPLTVVPARTDADLQADDGAVMRLTSADWLVEASTLVLGGVPVRPARGDRLVVDGVTYETLDFAGEGCWRWSDQSRTHYRVHTKEIAS